MQYVGYKHNNSDASTTDECVPQAHGFNTPTTERILFPRQVSKLNVGSPVTEGEI